MSSNGYLERLNAPTPWTQKIMPSLMRFRRGGGTVTCTSGHARGNGAHIAIARFEQALPEALQGADAQTLLDTLARTDWIVAARVIAVQTDATSIATREKSMRSSQEGAFAGLLVIEALDRSALDRAVTFANEALPANTAFDCYDAIFAHHRMASVNAY